VATVAVGVHDVLGQAVVGFAGEGGARHHPGRIASAIGSRTVESEIASDRR
jgi:hypothetical protein